jgi:hypothetical protein
MLLKSDPVTTEVFYSSDRESLTFGLSKDSCYSHLEDLSPKTCITFGQ